MSTPRLSLTEYAVLGLVAEEPSHGFALAKKLAADTEVGRVLTVRRPLVYRALDRLVDHGHVESVATEKGDAGPNRVIHRITQSGQRRLRSWLATPVEHVRDLRIEFLLKVAFLVRAESSPIGLIREQRAALVPTLAVVNAQTTDAVEDHVRLWRHHIAAASVAFLDDLELRTATDTVRPIHPMDNLPA